MGAYVDNVSPFAVHRVDPSRSLLQTGSTWTGGLE